VYWLLPPFFLLSLAIGGIVVPKLNLILSLICDEYFIERSHIDPTFYFTPVNVAADNPQCRIPEIQALVSKFSTYMMIITGLLSAIMCARMGAWSDRYGRTTLLVMASFGGLLGEVITILAGTYPKVVSYKWLLAGSAFDGLCGSFTAGMALTHAYATDCTPPPKRGIAFGYFHACLFGGVAFGPLLTAFLMKKTGTLLTIFYVALGIHIFFILFITFVVPESLTKKRQLVAREKHAAEIGDVIWNDQIDWVVVVRKLNILAPLKILFPTGPGTSNALRANLILLSAVDTTIFGVAMGAMTVVVYYIGYQFGWDTAQISIYASITSSFRVSALIIVLPLLNYLVRTRRANRQRRESGFATPQPNSGSDTLELSIIRVAMIFEIVGYVGFALARRPVFFVISGILAASGGVGSPTLQSALTKHVPHDKVGALLGATGVLHALTRVIAPTIFNLIYAGTVKTYPQAVFVIISGCFGVAFLFSWFIRPHSKSPTVTPTEICLCHTVYLEDPATVKARTRSEAEEAEHLLDEEIAAV
jgi:MFS family permease